MPVNLSDLQQNSSEGEASFRQMEPSYEERDFNLRKNTLEINFQ